MNSLLAALAIFAAVDVGEYFSRKEAWEEGAVDFAVEFAKDGFSFASQKRDIVYSQDRRSAIWMDRSVWETRIFYSPDSGPVRVEMSLFNIGDCESGDYYTQGMLDALVSAIQARYGDGTRNPPKPVKTKLKTGGFKYVVDWTKCDPAVELSWGVDEGRPDPIQYVRAILRRKDAPKDYSKSGSRQLTVSRLKNNVRKNADGDIWIDGVPMVDQGKKGYCAAAVSERILRYYGFDIDEHEIAQQAGSESRYGTRVKDMIAVINDIGVKRHLRFNRILSMSVSQGDIEKDVDQYNKVAKSMKEPDISLDPNSRGDQIYGEMKPKVLKKMRMKDARYRKFLTSVKAQIDKGVPLCWGVTLGIFPEPGVNMQTKGGHMRLIIGYNAKTREILYTDTWGAGHELKRMPEDWAFTITDDTFSLSPQ